MWQEVPPLFDLKIISNTNNNNSSQSTTTTTTSYIVDPSIPNAEIFNMRITPLHLIHHPNVINLFTENIQQQQQQSNKNANNKNINNINNNTNNNLLNVRISQIEPPFVVPLAKQWNRLNSSEIVQGVYETTKLLLFILQNTGLRLSSFSSAHLFRDLPQNEILSLSSTSSSTFPSLYDSTSSSSSTPNRYRWLLGDGKSFFDKNEIINNLPSDSRHEMEVMLLRGSAYAIARWLKDDVLSSIHEVLIREEEEVTLTMLSKRNASSSNSPVASSNASFDGSAASVVNSGPSTSPVNVVIASNQQQQQQQYQTRAWRNNDGDNGVVYLSDLIKEWAEKVENMFEAAHEEPEPKIVEDQTKVETTKNDDDNNVVVADLPKIDLQKILDQISEGDTIPVKSLSSDEVERFKQRLTNFYKKYAPDNVESVKAAITFNVTESKVFEKVCGKYNVDRLVEFSEAYEAGVAAPSKGNDNKKQSDLPSTPSQPAQSSQQKQKQIETDWSLQTLRDLIVLIQSWAISQRNDPLTTVLHIGQNIHNSIANNQNKNKDYQVESLFDILAETITLIPANVAARRIWPWFIRPAFLSQKHASVAFTRLVTFARLNNHNNINNNNNNSTTTHPTSSSSSSSSSSCFSLCHELLGPSIASSVTLTLITSARNVFSVQRTNALDILISALRRKTVEGKNQERKVPMLSGITVPLLVRVIIPELLSSLMQIMVAMSNSGSLANSAIAKNTNAIFTEIVGSPLSTISLLCQKYMNDTKQMQQAAAQIQKSLAEKVATIFGGKETCFFGMNNNENDKRSESMQEKWEKWNAAVSHLDCLDTALVVLYELMLHTKSDNSSSELPQQQQQDIGSSQVVVALRTKLFESLVMPVLGFVMMSTVNFCKQEEIDAKKSISVDEEQQKQEQKPAMMANDELSVQSRVQKSSSTPTDPSTSSNNEVVSVSELDDGRKTKQGKESHHHPPPAVPVADFAAERKKDRRRGQGRKTTKYNQKRSTRRRQYSDSEDEEEEEEEFEEEEEEEEEQHEDDQKIIQGVVLLPGNPNHDENNLVTPTKHSPQEDQLVQENEQEEEPASPSSPTESLCVSPTPTPSIVFLGHLSRMMAKLLFVWHRPGAVQNIATRGLLWQILLRSVNVFVASSSSSSSNVIKTSSKLIHSIFDPLVEAALSVKESIEQDIISSAINANSNNNTNNNSSSTLSDSMSSAPFNNNSNGNDESCLTSSQQLAAIIYFEIVQYLIPTLFHLSMRGISPSVPVQMLMKLLNLPTFLENLRASLKIEKMKKQMLSLAEDNNNKDQEKIKNADDDDDDDDEGEEEEGKEKNNENSKKQTFEAKMKKIHEVEKLAKASLHGMVLPWSISMDEASNALFILAKKQRVSSSSPENVDNDDDDENENETVSPNVKKIAFIWRSLPSLRDVCAQKLTFFKSTGNLLSEIAHVTLDNNNPNVIKNQVNWLMNSVMEGINNNNISNDAQLSTSGKNNSNNSKSNNNNNGAAIANLVAKSETFATTAALLYGGSRVSSPSGSGGIDSDSMMRSWHHNFLKNENSNNNRAGVNFISSEKAVLIHLMSRFGGKKEFDPFPLMPPTL